MRKLALSFVLVFAAAPVAASAAGKTTAGDASAGKSKATVCAACHGPHGNTPNNPQWPKIAGQNAEYIAKQLHDMKSGKRKNPPMAGIVANLSDQDIADLAAYYASLPMSGGYAAKEEVALGQKIYRGGDRERHIPACMGCHSPMGAGNPPAAFPRLAGQHAPYVVAQLQAFQSQQRDNDPNKMMRDTTMFMSEKEMKAVASYIAGLH